MKFTDIQQRRFLPIAITLIIGFVLGAAILLWKKDGAAGEGEEAHNEESHQEEKPKAAAQGHGDDEDLVKIDGQRAKAAGVLEGVAQGATIDTFVQLPGEVRFNEDRTAHIVPQVTGVAAKISAELGQAVTKGQLLAVIASPELAEMRSTLAAAQSRYKLAQTTYEREKKLWEQQITAEQDYLQAKQAFGEAEIEVQSAHSKLTAIGATATSGASNQFELRAPFDGVVVEKHISLGEAIKSDANVFLLSDLRRLWVDVAVTPKDIGSVRVGGKATVDASATELSATGTVTYVGSLVGEQTRTAKARVVIDNPSSAWRPGLYVNVALAQGSKSVAVAVPVDAVQTVEGKPSVFVKVPEGFRAQSVVTGISDGKLIEIVEGLKAGAKYAKQGSFVLKAEQGKEDAEHGH